VGNTRADPIFGLIKTDMVLASNTAGKATTFRIYGNTGSGGASLKADGLHFCDMRGTGYDDKIWVTQEGNVMVYGNKQTLPTWKSYGTVFQANRNRKDIHLADVSYQNHFFAFQDSGLYGCSPKITLTPYVP
jgi:hypothetical protein